MNCTQCGIETTNPKFCSKSCSALWTNKNYPKRKTKKRCLVCNEPVSSWRKTRCDKHTEEYKANKHLDVTLGEHRARYIHLHPSSIHASVRTFGRSLNKDMLKLPCHKCGYSKHVELAHIKPIASFPDSATIRDVNSKDNVIQLCPNCHWEFDHDLLFI